MKKPAPCAKLTNAPGLVTYEQFTETTVKQLMETVPEVHKVDEELATIKNAVKFFDCKNQNFEIPSKVKSVLLYNCEDCTLTVNGVFTSIDVMKCKKVAV